MLNAIRKSRRGQSVVEWVLLLSFIALITQVATSRTGTEIERIFQASADAIGIEPGKSADGEVISSHDDEGGIAASGRTARASSKAAIQTAQALD